jgi:predicted porin
MKKSLVALAALAVAGVASAQSSVTLFGVVDAAISGYSNKSDTIFGSSIKTSQTALTNSGYNSSRLGFRGTEDLGGGLAASFWLEAALGNDNGTAGASQSLTSASSQFFNRRSTVSLSGVFGEVRLGRDYVPTFWNDTVFDPFGTNGVGTNLISTANGFGPGGTSTAAVALTNGQYVRANNSIGYFLPPNLGGFYGQAMYALNEKVNYNPGTLTPPGAAAVIANPALFGAADVAPNSRAGKYAGARGGYANGPLDVALSYGESTIASSYFGGITSKIDTWNLGASWDFGVVKLFGEYSDQKLKTNSTSGFVSGILNPFGVQSPKLTGWLLGLTAPVGPGLIRFSYSDVKFKDSGHIDPVTLLPNDPKAGKWALGYVHNLSKRTALYATVARISNKDGASLTTGGPNMFLSPITITNPATGTSITTTPQGSSSVGYDFGIRHAF